MAAGRDWGMTCPLAGMIVAVVAYGWQRSRSAIRPLDMK
jgi:hypothetical protein